MQTSISFASPIGPLTVFAEDNHIIVLESGRAPDAGSTTPLLEEARSQLTAYFDGKRDTFDLPIAPPGTTRQKEIWSAMVDIPYGSVETYGDLAKRIESSARAVGGACAANPLPIIVPCHRVLPASSGIGAYSFAEGTMTKAQLLTLEGYSFDDGTGPEPDGQIALPL